MLTSSAKAKGRSLQAKVRKVILDHFKELKPDDVKSAVMGETGEDIQLSPFARHLLPVSIECKKHKSFAVYKLFEQAQANAKGDIEPVLVIEADRKKPLAVIDFEYYMFLEQCRSVQP